MGEGSGILSIAVLASGSRGNGTLIASAATILLIDCGLSARATTERLAEIGVEPQDITAILLTHEHSDHVGGVDVFARKYLLPVYLSRGTELATTLGAAVERHIISPHKKFSLGDIEISPVPVPHDAKEPCQFIFHSGGVKLGLLTDVGSITEHMIGAYDGCDCVMMEFNHDRQMLENGIYPAALKARVGGQFGHMNNAQAADFLDRIDKSRLRHIIAAHLSEQNNDREIVGDILGRVTAAGDITFALAKQGEIMPWYHCTQTAC